MSPATPNPNDPNQSPFAKQVHNDRKSTSVTGLDENTRTGLRNKLIESILQIVVQALTGVFAPGISAFSQLVSWVSVSLPAQIKEPLTALVNILVTVLNSIPIIGPPLGDAVQDLANMFGLLKDTTSVAQTTGDTALSEVQLLKAAVDGQVYGGAVVTEDFTEANSTTLAPEYLQFNVGGSTGTYGRRNGYGHFYGSFGTDQQIINLRQGALLNTSSQRSAMKTIAPVGGSGDTNVMVMARVSADGATFQFVQFFNATAVFGFYLSGTPHIIATMSVPSKGPELFELEVGAPGVPVGTNDWYTNIKKNGTPLYTGTVDLTVSYPAASVLLTSACRTPAFGAGADNFFGAQAIPGDIDTLTWADIAPSGP
jgi:hypothetical protein